MYDDQSNKEDVKIDDSLSRNTNCEIQEEIIGGREFLAETKHKYNVFYDNVQTVSNQTSTDSRR